MNRYLAILSPEPTGGYSVAFPDCPGCLAHGATINHARNAAKEALLTWSQSLRNAGSKVGPPRATADQSGPLWKGQMLMLIEGPAALSSRGLEQRIA